MKTIVIVMLMVFGVIVTNQQLEANQKKESAFDIKKFELVKSEKQIKLNFDLKSKVDGDYNYFIDASDKKIINLISIRDSSKKVIKESKIDKEWFFKLPEDGWELLKVKRGYVDNTVLNQSNQPVSVPNSFLLNQAKSTPDGKYQKGVML